MVARIFFVFISTCFFSINVFPQDCVVEMESLRGTYLGDCKKGKAHGKGKAAGLDSYEGFFKSGFPEGEGTYTWKNGNVYKGQFVKGFREGDGKMSYKRQNAVDSVVEGFWKKDMYMGKNEKPYTVYFQSKMITELEIAYKKDGFKQVTVFVQNTSGGGITVNEGELPKLKVDDVDLVKGSFGGRLSYNLNHVKKTESIIGDLDYPVRLRIKIGSEEVDIEFREPGSYDVNVRINQ
jgi:hypothetical protein